MPGPDIDEVPASIPSFEDDPYRYSLTYNFDDDYAADYAVAPTSDTVA